MRCDTDSLTALVLGDLNEAQSREAQAHVAACGACAQRLAELQRTVGLLALLPEVEAAPLSIDALKAAGASKLPRRRARILDVPARWGRLGLMAAAALLLVLVGLQSGLSVRAGRFELALGPRPARLDEAAVRNLAREEMAAQIQPALAELAVTLDTVDLRSKAQVVKLADAMTEQRTSDLEALAAQRANDLDEIRRNFLLLSSSVTEAFRTRAVTASYVPPEAASAPETVPTPETLNQ